MKKAICLILTLVFVLATLTAAADAEIVIDWSVSVDSTIARAHQHARNTTRLTGGWIERQGIRVKSPPTTASATPLAT